MEASTNSNNAIHDSNEQRELCDVLSHDLRMLNLRWETWQDLFLPDMVLTLLNNTAAGFFSLVQELLRESIAMGIGRMTDPESTTGRDNASIYKLLNMIQYNNCAGGDLDIATDLQTIDELCGKNSALKNLRHRRFAHSDFAIAVRKKPLEKIEDEQIAQLLDALDHVLNAVRTSLGMETAAHSSIVRLDGGVPELVDSLELSEAHKTLLLTRDFRVFLAKKDIAEAQPTTG